MGVSCWSFLDNEAARHCWISGHADTTLHDPRWHIVGSQSDGGPPFFARVLTFSDLADGPTKMSFDVCSKLGAERIRQDEPFLRRCALSNP